MSRISYSTSRCSVNIMNWTERLLFPQPPLLSCQHTPVTLGLLYNCTVNKWTLETCTTRQERPLQEPQASRRPAETEGRDINEFSSQGVVCTYISLERKGFMDKWDVGFPQLFLRCFASFLKLEFKTQRLKSFSTTRNTQTESIMPCHPRGTWQGE